MKKILLIEDNTEMRENTAEILELANYKVITAPNGKEGVKLAQGESPDLIISDIMMPELDGYGVLHMLSKDTTTAAIPFIFLTAKAEKSDYRKGMGLGADDYLTKPFDDMELLHAVETRLKKAERLKTEFTKDVSGLNAFITEAKSLDVITHVADNYKIKDYKKKEVIFTESANPMGIYFLNKGKVKIMKASESGKELITDLINEGDFFGYVALLEGETYTDSAQAMEDCEICMIPRDDFFALLYSNRDVASKFIKMLSNELAEKEERLVKLAYHSVRKRVAEALITIRDRYKKENDAKFSMAISREDLANIVGTAPETVIRTLSDFKDEKLIDIKASTITILDEGKLERMKN
jgi:CRP/FNR family transcriptional regulator, polysaccharide utilization system transcription regulator